MVMDGSSSAGFYIVGSGKSQPDDEATFYSNCSLCDWERYTREEWQGQVISVLHVVVRHEEAYFKTTGKHPEDARKEYAEKIRQFQDLL